MGSLFINQFLEYLKFQKKYSNHTIIAYKKDLEDFSDFLTELYQITMPDKITNEIVRTWLSNLIEKKINPVSVKRKLSAVKSFFKYLKKEKIIEKNPATNLTKLKTAKRIPNIINSKILNNIIDKTPENNYSDYVSYIIICILFGTGVRRNELITLKDNNVDTESRLIKVLGKRNKERIIPITNELAEQIEIYRKLKIKNNLHSETLLVTNKNKKLSPTYIYNTVKNILGINGVNGKKSPHILRHVYATEMLKNGAELLSVKELLGHSSLASTQVYTHVNIEDLKKIYKENHPKQ
ncbi:MAG: tyrosine-type recombinase/integrase [Bacteroidia bacterium]|nr:tyrosine-type recombinase/integrase [Bacteroidia bacterium]